MLLINRETFKIRRKKKQIINAMRLKDDSDVEIVGEGN